MSHRRHCLAIRCLDVGGLCSRLDDVILAKVAYVNKLGNFSMECVYMASGINIIHFFQIFEIVILDTQKRISDI